MRVNEKKIENEASTSRSANVQQISPFRTVFLLFFFFLERERGFFSLLGGWGTQLNTQTSAPPWLPLAYVC